jgi:hypothetical protein
MALCQLINIEGGYLGGDNYMEKSAGTLRTELKDYWIILFKLGIFLAPLIFVIGLAFVKWNYKHWYYRFLTIEDGPIETLTALIYLTSCVIALSVGRQLYHRGQWLSSIMYFFLSIGFLLICMEEISWGQRLFDLSTPEFFRTHNYQKEINLHNLSFTYNYLLHGSYILVGGYGALAFLIVWTGIVNRSKSSVDLFVPPWYLATYFFLVCLLYLYYDYLSEFLVAQYGEQVDWARNPKERDRYFMSGKDQEPMELILSLGFLLFVGINRLKLMLGRLPITSPMHDIHQQ